LKIKYNNKMTDKDKIMFDLAKEFILSGLKNKQIYDKLTLDLRRYKSKKHGLSYIGLFEVYKENEFVPKIVLYDYGINLYYNAYVLSGYKCLETLEQYRFKVLFHELGHLVDTYNLNPVDYEKFLNTKQSIFDQANEDKVNDMAIKFMLAKGIIKDGGVLIDEVDGEEKWWQLVLYRR